MRYLTHSPADIVRWFLVLRAVGTDWNLQQPWPVYAAGEPSKPDNVITTYDTTGVSHGSVMTGGPDDGELQGHYGFQIRIRATTHPIGWQKAHYIRAVLAQNANNVDVTIQQLGSIPTTSYLIENFANIGDVIDLGKNIANDKTNLFTLNGVISVNQRGL